jgi:hypothetical protein
MARTIVFSRGESGGFALPDFALFDLRRVAVAAAILAPIVASTLLASMSGWPSLTDRARVQMNVVRAGVNYRF